jgi:regulator of nucleoside diphosphate kinase
VLELPKVRLLQDEYELLSDLVCASPRPTAGIQLLWQELQRAEVLSPGEAPPDLVRLRSFVRFTDLSMGQDAAVQLVRRFPRSLASSVSVMTPVGAALIGLRPGDQFAWRSGNGVSRAIRINGVSADPEAEARRATASAEARRRLVRELLSLD